MIPTYNRVTYLGQALESVLQQDPGAGQMQIEVVDDCSPDVDPHALVSAVGRGRVTCYRQPRRLGISANWTECVRRARGRLVHILHEDDLVLPGFYQALGSGLHAHPEAGAAFTRHAYIDEDGHWRSLSPLEQPAAGTLPRWLERISVEQRIQCPAVVVRRDVYERLGGFHPALYYMVDWEMWMRIASRCAVWYEPRILACFRMHQESYSSALARSGVQLADVRRAIGLSRAYLPAALAPALNARAREHFAGEAVDRARQMLQQRRLLAAGALARDALRLSPTLGIASRLVGDLLGLCVRVGASRILRTVRRYGQSS
jgi:glycosyltransferase involved in cell wall biosynthesis